MSSKQVVCEVFQKISNDESVPHSHQSEEPCKQSFIVQETQEKIPFKCDSCKKEFKKLSLFQRHQRIHTGEKPFKCAVCQRAYSQSNSLNRHQIKHKEGKPFKCDICQKNFTRKDSLYIHQLLHKKEKPFKCGICQRTFIQKYGLLRHQSRNKCKEPLTEKKADETFPFKCDSCGKELKYFREFKTHQRIHTGEKPFKCTVCSKSFSDKSNLKRHQKSHNREKRFKCDICQQNFTYKVQLKKHQKLHKAEKPHKCENSQKTSHEKLKNQRQLNNKRKHCSSNLKYLNNTSTVVIQNGKHDSTKYLLNNSSLEDTSELTLKTTNLEFTFQQQQQLTKEKMHVSKGSPKFVEQICSLEDNAKNTFTTELCNKNNLGINTIMILQTNDISTAIMNLDQFVESPFPTLSDVNSHYREGISQSSENTLRDVNQTINALEHEIIFTKELNNEVCVKNNDLQSFPTDENTSEDRKLDKCDRCSFSSYDSSKVDIHYMGHFDEDIDPSDPTCNA